MKEKQRALGLIPTFLSMFFVASNSIDTTDYKARKEQRSLASILYQWNDNLRDGKRIGEYLNKRGYSKIAIYGLGELGYQLFKEINNCREISIVAFIDREKKHDFEGVKCMMLDESGDIDCDLVIITPLNDVLSIRKNLKTVLHDSVDILGIEDIIFEM